MNAKSPQVALLPVQLGTAILFHPTDAFRELRGRAGWKTACTLIGLTIVVRIVTIYMTSFHITGLQPQYANIALEIARFVLPLISGAIACYLVTAIMDGEAFFGEVLTAISYAMLPYIIFSIPIAALSNMLTRDELALYNGLNAAVWIWAAILIFIQLQALNDYSFAKSVGVSLLSLFAFVTFWATVGLVFALTNHVLKFANEVLTEIRYLAGN